MGEFESERLTILKVAAPFSSPSLAIYFDYYYNKQFRQLTLIALGQCS